MIAKIKVRRLYPKWPSRGALVEVSLPDWKNPVGISVYPRTETAKDSLQEVITGYGINWSALGTQSVENARLFCDGLKAAIARARVLTDRFKGKPRH